MARAGRALTRGIALVALAAGLTPASAAARSGPADACGTAVAQQRRDWGAVEPARPQPPDADGATIRHWPTLRIGVWVLEAVRDGTTRLTRVSPTLITEMTWSAQCTPSTRERARPSAEGPRFTDADLAALLTSQPRGVVYVWSPHMPLSIDALAALRQAADARRVHVAVVLARDADPRFARETAAARGWPADALRVADAVELVYRDVLVHAPAVLVYAGGRVRGSAWPGAHDAGEYGAYLDRVLSVTP